MVEPEAKRARRRGDAEVDADYFDSYAHFGIHEEMLRDAARTGAYRDAIRRCAAEDISGKVVLDVGCGTGILSLFCAEAGARKVYAVDASDIADQARRVVEHNGFGGVVQVIKGRVEDIDIPEEVDTIVSEWMGYFCFFESMLESVIIARDRFLKKGGKLFPAEARVYLAPFTNEWYDQRAAFWKNVYGFDFSPVLPFATKCFYEEPAVDQVPAQNLLTVSAERVFSIDCATVTREALQKLSSSFSFSCMASSVLHGFAGWFDVVFHGPVKFHPPDAEHSDARQVQEVYVLTTAPENGYTHWRQTLFYLDAPHTVVQDQQITGEISVANNGSCKRCTSVRLTFAVGDGPQVSKSFELC